MVATVALAIAWYVGIGLFGWSLRWFLSDDTARNVTPFQWIVFSLVWPAAFPVIGFVTFVDDARGTVGS